MRALGEGLRIDPLHLGHDLLALAGSGVIEWNDELAPLSQLAQQRFGNEWGSTGDEDAIEWGEGLLALVPIAIVTMCPVAEALEEGCRLVVQ